jgi:PEP-CTERM motif
LMGKSVMKNKSAIRLATAIGAATLLAFTSAATKAATIVLPNATASVSASTLDAGPASLTTPPSSFPLNVRSQSLFHGASASAAGGADPSVAASASVGPFDNVAGSAAATLTYYIEPSAPEIVPADVQILSTVITSNSGGAVASSTASIAIPTNSNEPPIYSYTPVSGNYGTFDIDDTILLVHGQVYIVTIAASAGAFQVDCADFTDCVTASAAAAVDPIFVPPPGASILMSANLALPSAVPEPSTWGMILLGFTGIGFARYRAARRASTAIA